MLADDGERFAYPRPEHLDIEGEAQNATRMREPQNKPDDTASAGAGQRAQDQLDITSRLELASDRQLADLSGEGAADDKRPKRGRRLRVPRLGD